MAWDDEYLRGREDGAEAERAACAGLVRAGELAVFRLLHKSLTRDHMAREIVGALAAAIEARKETR